MLCREVLILIGVVVAVSICGELFVVLVALMVFEVLVVSLFGM
jgi:hypothetical protein